VTRDGRLSCRCDPRTGCTCRPVAAKRITRDAGDDLVGAVRRTDAHPVLLTAAMCLAHMSQRLERLEAGNGGDDIDARFAAAEQKRVELLKQKHIDKIEQAVATSEALKQPDVEPDGPDGPSGSTIVDPPQGQHEPFGGRFDPSVGSQSQKTSAHPFGPGSEPMRPKTRDAMHQYGMNISSRAETPTPVETRLTSPLPTEKGGDDGELMRAAYRERGESAAEGDVGAEVGRGNARAPLPPLTWAGMNGVGKERGGTNFGAPGKMVPDQPENENKDTTEAEENLREIRTGDENRRWRAQQYRELASAMEAVYPSPKTILPSPEKIM
jgi:hypothetical protein